MNNELLELNRRRDTFNDLLILLDLDEDDRMLLVERRQYKMHERIDLSKWDNKDFIYRFRLSKGTVVQLLQRIKSSLVHIQKRSRYIRPIAQVLIALRFYALGSMQVAIADFAGVSISSVSNIIKKVSLAIAQHLSTYIQMPRTETDLTSASEKFYCFARFPRSIGAIDCTHVRIESPGGENAEYFRNRKGWFSLNVQAVCSAEMKVINIVARWPGASHDQTIFNNSNLKMQLERGDFRHFIIVGESGYRNTHYLATPLHHCESDVHQLYNESHIRTRNVIERTFGVIKRRFPVLALGLRVKLETTKLIIVACAILHNIAIDAKEPTPPTNIENLDYILSMTEVPHVSTNERNATNNARDSFLLRYFQTLVNYS